MKIIQSKKSYKSYGTHKPHTVTLHHTAGGRVGSEDYLKLKGLGYHYMIDKDGTVYSYNPITDVVGHSSKANRGYVGVSYVSGGTLGPVNEVQLQASRELLKDICNSHPSVHYVSDHATIDILVAVRGHKTDPQWPGEKVEQNVWSIKHKYIDDIASYSGLTPIKCDGKKKL